MLERLKRKEKLARKKSWYYHINCIISDSRYLITY